VQYNAGAVHVVQHVAAGTVMPIVPLWCSAVMNIYAQAGLTVGI